MSSSRQSRPPTTIVIPTLFVIMDVVVAFFVVIPYLIVYLASSVQIVYKFAFTLAFICAICVGVLGNAIPMKTERVRPGAFLSIPATRGGMLAARVIFIVACVLGVIISATLFISVMRDEQARRDVPIDHENDGDENDEAVNEPIDHVFTHGKISLVTAVGFIVYILMYLIGTVISHLLREHTRFFHSVALPTIFMKLPRA